MLATYNNALGLTKTILRMATKRRLFLHNFVLTIVCVRFYLWGLASSTALASRGSDTKASYHYLSDSGRGHRNTAIRGNQNTTTKPRHCHQPPIFSPVNWRTMSNRGVFFSPAAHGVVTTRVRNGAPNVRMRHNSTHDAQLRGFMKSVATGHNTSVCAAIP